MKTSDEMSELFPALLAGFALDEASRRALLQKGGLQVLIKILKKPTSMLGTVRYASFTISAICGYNDAAPKVAENIEDLLALSRRAAGGPSGAACAKKWAPGRMQRLAELVPIHTDP